MKLYSLCFLSVELPGAPSNLVISNISPRTATLRFRPGSDGKTAISRWIVEGQVRALEPAKFWNTATRKRFTHAWSPLVTDSEGGWEEEEQGGGGGWGLDSRLGEGQPARHWRHVGGPRPHSVHPVQVNTHHTHEHSQVHTNKLIRTNLSRSSTVSAALLGSGEVK